MENSLDFFLPPSLHYSFTPHPHRCVILLMDMLRHSFLPFLSVDLFLMAEEIKMEWNDVFC